MKNIKYSSLFHRAFTLVADNFGFWLKMSCAIALPLGLFSGLIVGFVLFAKEQIVALEPLPIVIISLLGLLFSFLFSVLLTGAMKINLNLIDGKEISLNVLFSQTSKALPFLVLSSVYMVIVALGFIALIIPGIIALVRLSWAFVILIDQHCGIIESLRRSYALTQGYFWEVATFCLICSISMKVFFLLPIVSVAYLSFYREVSKQDDHDQPVVIDPITTKSTTETTKSTTK